MVGRVVSNCLNNAHTTLIIERFPQLQARVKAKLIAADIGAKGNDIGLGNGQGGPQIAVSRRVLAAQRHHGI